MEDATYGSDSLLTHGLLSAIGAFIFSGVPHPEDREPRVESQIREQLVENLREIFRARMPAADVSDDVALGRAVEDLAIRFRIRGQGF